MIWQSKIARVVAGTFILMGFAAEAGAQSPVDRREGVNQGVVGIVSSTTTSSMTRFTEDIADVVNDLGRLRVLPILGRGAIGNIEDLLYLRGVDLAIVQGDVLDFFQRFQAEPGITEKVRYVAELGKEEVHLMARAGITSIDQLQGGRVNFGPEESGSFMTASVLFDSMGFQVTASTMRHADAIKALQQGQIDAMLYASSAPIPLFADLTSSSGVQLIDIPAERARIAGQYPATITSQHYPALVPAGNDVATISIATVMAAYNWPKDHPRHAAVSQFMNAFYSGFDTLRSSENYHPAWKNMNLQAEVPGWGRFQ